MTKKTYVQFRQEIIDECKFEAGRKGLDSLEELNIITKTIVTLLDTLYFAIVTGEIEIETKIELVSRRVDEINKNKGLN